MSSQIKFNAAPGANAGGASPTGMNSMETTMAVFVNLAALLRSFVSSGLGKGIIKSPGDGSEGRTSLRRFTRLGAAIALLGGLQLLGANPAQAQSCPSLYQTYYTYSDCGALSGSWSTFKSAQVANYGLCLANPYWNPSESYLGSCSPGGAATDAAVNSDCPVMQSNGVPSFDIAVYSHSITPTVCGMPVKNLGAQSCPTPPKAGPIVANPINASTGNKYQDETDYLGVGAFPLAVFIGTTTASATGQAMRVTGGA
jgi:hypothetical protein